MEVFRLTVKERWRLEQLKEVLDAMDEGAEAKQDIVVSSHGHTIIIIFVFKTNGC